MLASELTSFTRRYLASVRFCHPGSVPGRLPGPAVPAATQSQGDRSGPGHHFLLRGRLPPRQRGGGGDRGREGQTEHPQHGGFHQRGRAGGTRSRGRGQQQPGEHHLRRQEIHREDLRVGRAGAGECSVPVQGGSQWGGRDITCRVFVVFPLLKGSGHLEIKRTFNSNPNIQRATTVDNRRRNLAETVLKILYLHPKSDIVCERGHRKRLERGGVFKNRKLEPIFNVGQSVPVEPASNRSVLFVQGATLDTVAAL